MNDKITALIEKAKTKLGLEHYYLYRQYIDRDVTMFNETKYYFTMEWIPSHLMLKEDDDLNPEGTAVVEMDIHEETWKSVVFVGGMTYATEITIPSKAFDDVVTYVEIETGLTYDQHFQLNKQENNHYIFHPCIKGIPIYPSERIQITVDNDGRLLTFAKPETFPMNVPVDKRAYELSLSKIEHIAKQQLRFIHLPADDIGKTVPVYGIEEVFIANDALSTRPFDLQAIKPSTVVVQELLEWEETIGQPFHGIEIDMDEEVTIEEALVKEPSPATKSITTKEANRCIEQIRKLFRQEYKEDSGRWVVTTLHRDKRYIVATVRLHEEEMAILKRKITVLLDAERLKVDNYVDNHLFLDIINKVEKVGDVTVTKEEAFNKLKPFVRLTPTYCYDVQKHCYYLYGKLDSNLGVHAHHGEVINLEE